MVKFSTITAIVIWIGGVITALLMEQLDPTGPSYDLTGYNQVINYISDLGNQDLTPMLIIFIVLLIRLKIEIEERKYHTSPRGGNLCFSFLKLSFYKL